MKLKTSVCAYEKKNAQLVFGKMFEVCYNCRHVFEKCSSCIISRALKQWCKTNLTYEETHTS